MGNVTQFPYAVTRLYSPPSGSAANTPVILYDTTDASHDRISKVAFVVQPNNGKSQLFIMNSDGTGAGKLTSSNANDSMPSFCPAATPKAVFISDRNGTNEMFVVGLNASLPVKVTGGPAGQYLWLRLLARRHESRLHCRHKPRRPDHLFHLRGEHRPHHRRALRPPGQCLRRRRHIQRPSFLGHRRQPDFLRLQPQRHQAGLQRHARRAGLTRLTNNAFNDTSARWGN